VHVTRGGTLTLLDLTVTIHAADTAVGAEELDRAI
jgi:hypothetical protein